MVTLKDIETKTFNKSFMGGYKPEDVDKFLDEISDSFKILIKEKDDLNAQILMLNQRIDKYKEDEEYLKKAILEAHRMRDDLKASAQNEADLLIKEAKIKSDDLEANARKAAEEIMNNAAEEIRKNKQDAEKEAKLQFSNYTSEINKEKAILDGIKKEVHDFKAKLFSIYKEHLEGLNNVTNMVNKLNTYDSDIKKLSENNLNETDSIDNSDKMPDDKGDTKTIKKVTDSEISDNTLDNETDFVSETAQFEAIKDDSEKRVEFVSERLSDAVKNDIEALDELPDEKYDISDIKDVFSESEVSEKKYEDIKFGVDYDISTDFDYNTSEIDLSSTKADSKKRKNKFKYK